MARRTPTPTIRPRVAEDEDELPPEANGAGRSASYYPDEPIYGDANEGLTAIGSEIDPTVQELPIFGNAARAGQVARVRVESMDVVTSTFRLEGYLAANASESVLISRWPRAGVFRVTPVDVNNQAVGAPRQIDVSPTNSVLQAALAAHGAQTPQGNIPNAAAVSAGGVDNTLLSSMVEILRAQLDSAQTQSQLDRQRAEEALRDAAEKQANAAVMIAENQRTLAERLIAEQAEAAKRQAEITAQQVAATQAQQASYSDAALTRMMQISSQNEQDAARRLEFERSRAAQEREIERERRAAELERMRSEAEIRQMEERARREAEREEAKLAIERERIAARERIESERVMLAERQRLYAEAAAERERERERIAEREREREERARAEERERRMQFEERMEQLRREDRERDKQHREELERMQQAKDPLGATIGLVTTLAATAKKIGFDPAEMLSGLISAKSSGWADTIKEGLGLVKTVVVASTGGTPEDEEESGEEDPNAQVVVRLPDGRDVQMSRAQLAQLQAMAAQRQAQAQAQAQVQAQQPRALPAPMPWSAQGWSQPPANAEQAAMMQLAMGQQAGPGLPQQAAVAAHPPQQPVFAPPPPPGAAVAAPAPGGQPADGVIRQAIIRLVSELESSSQADWPNILMRNLGEIQNPEALMSYLQRMTISGALREAGAEPMTIQVAVSMLDLSGQVPANIPR